MRRRAIIRVTDALLKQLLGIRPDLELMEITFQPRPGTIELLLGGEGLPVVREQELPRCVGIEDIR